MWAHLHVYTSTRERADTRIHPCIGKLNDPGCFMVDNKRILDDNIGRSLHVRSAINRFSFTDEVKAAG